MIAPRKARGRIELGGGRTEDIAMSRGEFQNDVDQIHEFERDIAELLNRGEATEIDKGTIENGYSLLDANHGEIVGSLHEKCAAIIGVLKDQYSIDAEYSIMDGTIRFAPNRPR
jgi:hypothetical protein